MAIFDRFRRNRDQSVLPDEVKQYYQTENRQRRGMAVVLALLALLATVAVAAGLFFGGRFIYNAIRDDGTEETAQPASDQAPGDQEQKPENAGGEGNNGGQNPTPTPEAPGTQQPATPPNPETQTPAPTPAPAPAPAPSPMPRTGDEGM